MTPPEVLLAIDVGGTTVKGELVDAGLTTLATATAPTPRGDAALDAIGDLGDHLLAQAGDPVAGAGVVVPGLVDPGAGVASYSANIGWRDLALAAPLSGRWGVPVRLGHDVAAAAVAEIQHGAGRGRRDVGFVVVGTGIAAVLVSGGRIVNGPHGEITELGHVPVRRGTPCRCGGDGCLEAVASAAAIARQYAERSGRPVTGAADVVARLADDPAARDVWQRAVEALAEGIALLALVAAPELVVVGGGLAAAGDLLVRPLARAVKDRTRVVAPPDIALAELGSRGGVAGAAMLARAPWDLS